jgi:hypothetical protein
MYEEAEKLLVDKKITPDEFKSLVEAAALEKNKYGQPTFAKPISESEIRKTLPPAVESTQKIVESKQEKLLKEFADLKAKEAVDRASQESLGLLPEDTASQITKATKERVLQNPKDYGFTGMKSEEVVPVLQEQREKLISKKESLADVFPSLKGTSMDPAEERAFRKILNMTGAADIPGYELQDKLRQLRDRGFTEEGKLSDKPAASTSKQIRGKISELSPEAGKLMEAENVEINKLKELESAGYITRENTGTATRVTMDDSQRRNLVKDLATAYDKEKPTDVVERLEILKKYASPDDFRKLELAAAKMAEKSAGDVNYVSFRPINAILQALKYRKVSRGIATAPEAIGRILPEAVTKTAKTLGRGAYKALPYVGAGVGGIAAQAAEEAFDAETSGATSDMPEYWLERGIRDPEEQIERARLSSFRKDLPDMGKVSDIPSPFEKPEIRQRKEETLAAKKAGALAPTYVEKPMKQVLKSDNPAEIASFAQALQSSSDRASQEYGRVLSQVANAAPRERDSLLFGLNQQPAFRQLVRQLREQEMGDEEEELPYIKGTTDLY